MALDIRPDPMVHEKLMSANDGKDKAHHASASGETGRTDDIEIDLKDIRGTLDNVTRNFSGAHDWDARVAAHKEIYAKIEEQAASNPECKWILAQARAFYNEYQFLGAAVLPDLIKMPTASLRDDIGNYSAEDRRKIAALDLAGSSRGNSRLDGAENNRAFEALDLADVSGSQAKLRQYAAHFARDDVWGNHHTLIGAMHQINKELRAKGEPPVALQLVGDSRETFCPPGWREGGKVITLQFLQHEKFPHYNYQSQDGSIKQVKGDGACQRNSGCLALAEHDIKISLGILQAKF